MTDALTKPERTCSRAQARTIREHVLDDGGCAYCTRRAGLFETVGRRALCGLDPPKKFPACIALPGGFEFDEAAYREGAGKDMRGRGDG
jgi:hypothetical protein